jgi:hypothetical protein
VAIKAAMTAGTPLATATETARFTSAMAGARQALNAGRDLVMETVKADPDARGLVRVASPGACDFCQEIADYSEGNPALLERFPVPRRLPLPARAQLLSNTAQSKP